MTKSFQKHKQIDKNRGTGSALVSVPFSFKKFFTFALIIILPAIPFVLGKYYEFNTPDPFDSAANVYSAKHILDGAKIGVEEIPSAALGTLLVNILGVKLFGFNEFGPKFIQGIFQAFALILMFIASRKLFGTLAAAVSITVASSYLSFPYIAKFGNVKEQYMIACMMMGISCFILYQLSGKWLFACLAGAFLIWAPLFKETGTSALGALGLFIIAQPFLKNRTWKQTLTDLTLLAAGAISAIAPVYIWIIGWKVNTALPYAVIWNFAAKLILPAKSSAPAGGSYVSQAWKIMPFAELWPRAVRFCLVLILPVALAVAAITARLVRLTKTAFACQVNKPQPKTSDRFVLLLAVWWLLDMAFALISPRSYEQYYLPLNASAAFLGGYLISLYNDALATAKFKLKWRVIGAASLICMIAMSWHIFFGIQKSAWSGLDYGEKRHGYAQSLKEISLRKKLGGHIAYWEPLADYIRLNSSPKDKIYVWGWYPGIYVQAQRLSASPKASESEMHIKSPQALAEDIQAIVTALEKEKPKFIVDSRKRHLPLDRPPFELWPITPEGFMEIKEPAFLSKDKKAIFIYDKIWVDFLRERFGEDEAQRYKAFKPLRDFVMTNYHIVKTFGDHVLFELNSEIENKEQK